MAVSLKQSKPSSGGGFLSGLSNVLSNIGKGFSTGSGMPSTVANAPKPTARPANVAPKKTPIDPSWLAPQGSSQPIIGNNGVVNPGEINEAAKEPVQPTDPSSYLQQAYSMLGNGQSVESLMQGVTPSSFGDFGYGNLISDAQSQGAANQQTVQNLYNGLAQRILGQAGTVAQPFDAGVSDVNSRGQQTSSDIANAYNNALSQQTNQLQQLGIGDAAAIIQNNGQSLAQQSAGDQSNALQRAQIIANQLGQNKTSALNYNTDLSQGTARTGVDDSAAIANNVAKQVAQYQQAETQAQQSAYNSAVENAQKIASTAPTAADAVDVAKYLQSIDPNSYSAAQTADTTAQKQAASDQASTISQILKIMSTSTGKDANGNPVYPTESQAAQVVSAVKKSATK